MRTLVGVLLLIAGAVTTLGFLAWGAFGLLLSRAAREAHGGDPPPIAGIWPYELIGTGIAAAALITGGLMVLRRAPSRGVLTPRPGTRAVIGLVVVAIAGLFGPAAWFSYQQKVEREQSMLPPALLSRAQAGSMVPLFDGNSTEGWTIEGPSRASEGTLEIGGDLAASARLEREFQPGETVRFHFKHMGPGHHPNDAKLYVEPILGDANDGMLKYTWQQPPEHELRQSGLTHIGGLETWYEAILRTKHEGGQFDYSLELCQRIGREGGPQSLFSRTSVPILFRLVFKVSQGNQLLLRNVYIAPAG